MQVTCLPSTRAVMDPSLIDGHLRRHSAARKGRRGWTGGADGGMLMTHNEMMSPKIHTAMKVCRIPLTSDEITVALAWKGITKLPLGARLYHLSLA